MNDAGVGPAFGLFVLETVQFGQHLDRNEDMVVLEPVQTVRVVQQNVRIEDKVLG